MVHELAQDEQRGCVPRVRRRARPGAEARKGVFHGLDRQDRAARNILKGSGHRAGRVDHGADARDLVFDRGDGVFQVERRGRVAPWAST
jgi:hypothetical protein